MKDAQITRIVAVDVKSGESGYAVFETPLRLVDWGLKGEKGYIGNARCIADLLALFQPSVVVMLRIATNSKRNSVSVRRTVQAVRGEARRASLPVAIVSERAAKTFFERQGFRTRHEIASALAASFPELAWKLPPHRKMWQTEYARLSIFDAVSLALTYFARHGISIALSRDDGAEGAEFFRRSLR